MLNRIGQFGNDPIYSLINDTLQQQQWKDFPAKIGFIAPETIAEDEVDGVVVGWVDASGSAMA